MQKLLYGLTGDPAVTGDQLVAINTTGAGAVAFTLEADGGFTWDSEPTVTQTIDRYVIKADGTIGTEATFTYTVAATAAPTMPSDESVDVAEGQTAVGNTSTATAGTAPITYSISGGVDAASFSINSSTGALTFLSAPDYETKTSYVVNVAGANAYGSSVDEQVITITVTNVLEETITDQGDLSVEVPYGVTGLAKTDSLFTDWLALWTDADSNNSASLPATLLVSNGAYTVTFSKADAPDVTGDFTVTNAAAIAPSWAQSSITINVVEGTNTIPAAAGIGDDLSYVDGGTDAALITTNASTGVMTLSAGVFTAASKASYSYTRTASSIHGSDAVQTITLNVVLGGGHKRKRRRMYRALGVWIRNNR